MRLIMPGAGSSDRLPAGGLLRRGRRRRDRSDQSGVHERARLRPEGLPYAPPYPWRPRAGFRPELQRQATEAFAHLLNEGGSIRRRPGTGTGARSGWRPASPASRTRTRDGDGRRHVARCHGRALRQAARIGARRHGLFLSEAGSLPEAVRRTVEELHELWRARRVLAVTFSERGAPQLAAATGPATGGRSARRSAAEDHRPRRAAAAAAGRRRDRRIGITMEHRWPARAVDRARSRAAVHPAGRRCWPCWRYLVQALHRADQIDQQRETAIALQRAILGPAQLRPTSPPLRAGDPALEVGGTGTTSSGSRPPDRDRRR